MFVSVFAFASNTEHCNLLIGLWHLKPNCTSYNAHAFLPITCSVINMNAKCIKWWIGHWQIVADCFLQYTTPAFLLITFCKLERYCNTIQGGSTCQLMHSLKKCVQNAMIANFPFLGFWSSFTVNTEASYLLALSPTLHYIDIKPNQTFCPFTILQNWNIKSCMMWMDCLLEDLRCRVQLYNSSWSWLFCL